MRGVRFTSDMRPWRANETALLPDKVAARMISDGVAEAYRFPDAPHGNEAEYIASTRDMGVETISVHHPRRTYRTKDA